MCRCVQKVEYFRHWPPAPLAEVGTTLLSEPGGDIRWHVLSDPGGNEFCAFTGD